MPRRSRRLDPTKIFTPRLFAAALIGSLMAVLAFSQAAASIGLPIATFRPLGAGFFSMRSVQLDAAKSIIGQGRPKNTARVASLGRQGLVYAPLNTRALWLVGQSWDAPGRTDLARNAMLQAQRVSRRDAAVQLWLALDNLKNRKIPQGLHNFDLLIRTNAQAASLVTPVLAKVITSPQGRRQMAPYFSATNPWFPDLLWASASTLPKGAPLAQLLIDQKGRAPDGKGVRGIYTYLLKKLLNEGSYDLAIRLYPKLPGADIANLRSLDPSASAKAAESYPPFVWGFAETESQGGGLVSLPNAKVGFEVFGSPGTAGIAASKLFVPAGDLYFHWRILDRSGNPESSANWVLTCLLGESAGAVTKSGDLFSAKSPADRGLAMPIPSGCQLARADLHISGGIGRDPAELIVGGFGMGSAAQPS